MADDDAMRSDLDELVRFAVDVARRAHCPYSGYHVGAAIRTTGGDVYVGCNVENASYPEGTCAEAGAIAAMVADAGPDTRIARIVTVSPGAPDGSPGTPCGGCRQRIREFATPDTVIHSTTLDAAEGGAGVTMSIDDLLPHGFGPDNLG